MLCIWGTVTLLKVARLQFLRQGANVDIPAGGEETRNRDAGNGAENSIFYSEWFLIRRDGNADLPVGSAGGFPASSRDLRRENRLVLERSKPSASS